MTRRKILVDFEALRTVLSSLRRSPGSKTVGQLQDIDRPYIHNNPITVLYNDYQDALNKDLFERIDRSSKNDQSTQAVPQNSEGYSGGEGNGAGSSPNRVHREDESDS